MYSLASVRPTIPASVCLYRHYFAIYYSYALLIKIDGLLVGMSKRVACMNMCVCVCRGCGGGKGGEKGYACAGGGEKGYACVRHYFYMLGIF